MTFYGKGMDNQNFRYVYLKIKSVSLQIYTN